MDGKTARGWQGRLHTSLDQKEPNIIRVTRTKEYSLPICILTGFLNSVFFKPRYTKTEMEELH